jgi:Arc/MetJ family transcription regulator
MAKTLIDVDDDLLARSQQILGTATKKETVNGALRELVRRAAAEEFLAFARSGGLRDAADPEVMAKAWR